MKKLLILIIILSANIAQAHDFKLVTSTIPKQSLFKDHHGKQLTLHNFRGNLTILNFWATWCKPCVVELPSLNKLQTLIKPYGSEIIAIVPDNNEGNKAKSFLRRLRLNNLNYYVDVNKNTAASFNVNSIPMSYIVNGKGHVVAFAEGAIDWTSRENIKFIRTLLAKEL